ncbi:MAG: polyamine aminopropyltransferase [Myxococcales bacterium]|nr:polyamine aminopropyltransferase [Myxococcales bacterium]MCB9641918.1 polyamine aminopropyltransferase [Myxococcales bacterium]
MAHTESSAPKDLAVQEDVSSASSQDSTQPQQEMGRRKSRILLFSIMLIATNGVIYELLIGGYSSYLLGDSITQFSLTIGLFMSSMGVGSWLTQRFEKDLEQRFIEVELLLAIVGGPTVLLLAMAHIYTRLYAWVMFAMIIAIGCLIGFEIPLVTRIVERYGGLKKALANVLSFDYIGALFGSLLFPLVLLPELGFTRTSFLIGIVNLGVAWVNLWVFHDDLRKGRMFLWIGTFVSAALLTVGFFYSAGWIERARETATQQKLVYLEHTPYQHLRFVKEQGHKHPIYRLYLNGEHQFSSNSERRYHEALVHPAMSAATKRQRVLILGGGDALALREVRRYKEVREIVMVDLDPAMTRFARNHPIMRQLNEDALHDPRLKLYNMDAAQFLKRPNKPFDVVILDLPVPTQIALSKLYSIHFYRLLRRVTHPQSVLVTEAAVLNPIEYKPFWSLHRTQQKAGWHVYPFVLETMAFLMFRQTPLQTQDLRLKVQTQALQKGALAAAFSLPPDATPHRLMPANTLDTHALMNLILQLR